MIKIRIGSNRVDHNRMDSNVVVVWKPWIILENMENRGESLSRRVKWWGDSFSTLRPFEKLRVNKLRVNKFSATLGKIFLEVKLVYWRGLN